MRDQEVIVGLDGMEIGEGSCVAKKDVGAIKKFLPPFHFPDKTMQKN